MTAKEYSFGEDTDNDSRPDRMFFMWRSICYDPLACSEIPTLKLHLEAEHDTDPSQSFSVDHQMDYYNNYGFSLGPEILEDPAFTYRFTIEDASDPEVFDVYGPFKEDKKWVYDPEESFLQSSFDRIAGIIGSPRRLMALLFLMVMSFISGIVVTLICRKWKRGDRDT